jgi:hypothetical protein
MPDIGVFISKAQVNKNDLTGMLRCSLRGPSLPLEDILKRKHEA